MLRKKPTNLVLLRGVHPLLSDGQLIRGSSAKLCADPRRSPPPQERHIRELPRRCSVPLYVLPRPPPLGHFHLSRRQISFVVSHPASFRALQETLLMRFGRHLKGFCNFSGSEAESESDDRNERVSSTADPKDVETVCQVINELFVLDRNMEAVLDESSITLSSDLVIAVLEHFKHAWKPAARFFCWAGEKPGFTHDSRTYNAMMTILGETRQFETMVSMLEEMGEKKLLTIKTFVIAIKAFGSAKHRKKAAGLFQLMKKYNFKIGVDTVNTLLDVLGQAKLANEAQVLFKRLRARFEPDLQTYSVLINGWCQVRNLVEAGQLWNEMTDRGFVPDVVVHNIMIEGLLKAKKRSDAIKLFMIMKAKRCPSPNLQSYTIMIRDLCKKGDMDEAVEYFNSMVESGIAPNAAVYTWLITGFGNNKEVDSAFGVLKEMEEKNCPPDGRLYNSLIRLMTIRKMPEDAARVYSKMVQSGIKPTIHTYNMMMKGYFSARNFGMGREVWDEMVRRGFCPDNYSYALFIGGLIMEGSSEEAYKYLEEMMEKGMRVPVLDYHKWAADFSRASRLDMLEEMARKMRAAGKFKVSGVFARWAEIAQIKGLKRAT